MTESQNQRQLTCEAACGLGYKEVPHEIARAVREAVIVWQTAVIRIGKHDEVAVGASRSARGA